MSTDVTHEHNDDSKTLLGFWIYLMTDCIFFACLFATYAVLQSGTNGGPPAGKLFDLPATFIQTLVFLTSSFTCSLIGLAAHRRNKRATIIWILVTLALGIIFMASQWHQWTLLLQGGNGWQRSAFLSSYFNIVASHAAHVVAGFLWMAVMVGQILLRGLTPNTLRRCACLRMFWHFLMIIWVFIFTLVYLMGAV